MKIQIPLYLLICLLGVLIGLQLQPSPEPGASPTAVPGAPLKTTDNSLTSTAPLPPQILAQLQNQQALLEHLDKRLSEETRKTQALAAELKTLAGNATPENKAPENTASEPPSASHQSDNAANTTAGNQGSWFNENALVNAGFSSDKAGYLRQKFEEREMKRLYLRDQAAREGWLNTDRYRQARRELSDNNDLRQELSQQEYEAYLYAAGRPNRVLVSSTLQSSPAGKAGIQAGDIIVRYGDTPIYTWRDLREATTQGEAGSMVTVTLQRNGTQQQVYLPRGPLGVQLGTDSVAPSP